MTPSRRVDVFAAAKVNLALHVVGQRADGYHLLDTFVMFADVGDRVWLTSEGPLEIAIDGPEADPVLSSNDNIMWQVAAAFWTPDRHLRMGLDKHLPLASGIGGGSADAAACYRGILVLRSALEGGEPWLPELAHIQRLMEMGADIPMCVLSDTARVQGIGERIEPVTGVPPLACVLVNPRVGVATPPVFKALAEKNNPEMAALPEQFEYSGLVDWLAQQRNDLQGPAMALVPEIGQVLGALQGVAGCDFARMSGSGATCFGLFADQEHARAGAEALAQAHPDWWVRDCTLGLPNLAEPKLS